MLYAMPKPKPRVFKGLQLCSFLGECRRIVIVGGPRRGKSTLGAMLAERLGAPHRATDSLVEGREWSEVSDAAADWIREPGPQVVEGVAAVRALRKLLRSGERPGVIVVRLSTPLAELTPEQENQSKGHETIWAEVEPELRRRGVLVFEADVT